MRTLLTFFAFLFVLISFSQVEREEAVPLPPPPNEVKKEQRAEVQVQEVIEFPDVDAEFPGGTGAMMKFIQENVTYPLKAIEKGIEGKVYLTFIVEQDGSLSNIKVERGADKNLDREAMRVLHVMPKWKPGEYKGKVVRTRCRIPIVFTLDSDDEEIKKKKR